MKKLIIIFLITAAITAHAQDKIIGIEWWIDNDYSTASYQTVTPATEFDGVASLNLSTVPKGRHNISLRFQSQDGLWSPVIKKSIVKTPAGSETPLIVAVEYWMDNDTSTRELSVLSQPVQTTSSVSLDLTGITIGRHQLFLRFKDSNGQWSPIITKNINKTPEGDNGLFVSACEYWIDGNYATRELHLFENPNTSIDTTFGLDMTMFDDGGHLLALRFIDNIGNLSAIHRNYIRKYPVGNNTNLVTGYRYWFNDSVETLTHVDFDVAQSPIETVINVPVNQFDAGDTVMISLQFRDLLGDWSGIVADTFKVWDGVNVNNFFADSKNLLLYPNPASRQITLELINVEQIDFINISLFDLQGKKVIEKQIKNYNPSPLNLDISNLKRGIYYIKIETNNNKLYSKKLIVK